MAPATSDHRRGRYRRILHYFLVSNIVLAACVPSAAAETDGLFAHYEIMTTAPAGETVLPGFFLGGATAELAFVYSNESDARRLHMYGFRDSAWHTVLEATLDPGVLFVDTARIGGRERLIAYGRGGLSWFDPDTGKQHELVALATSYHAAVSGEVPQIDITRDVNHDGRDDIVLPDLDGFWIATQMSNGSFTEAVKLGPAEPFLDEIGLDDPRSYRAVGITALTVPWYLSRVHEMDYDHDGRSDLVFWNRDHFDVYRQDARGLFDTSRVSFTTDVPFDSDGSYTLMSGLADENMLALVFGLRKQTRRTVLHTLRDLNGDGVADLVLLTLTGRSLMQQRSSYQVHFGARTPAGTSFARNAGTEIRPEGKAGAMQPWGYASQLFTDIDGDGQIDVMFRDVRVGIRGGIRALAGNSIAIDLEFFRGEEGLYPDKPAAKRQIRPDIVPFGRRGPFFPAVLLGDVNGDGHADLLVGKSWDELHVFVGVPGPHLFALHPQTVAVAMPNDERDARLIDLNGDGKQDLIVGPSATAPHRWSVLLAR